MFLRNRTYLEASLARGHVDDDLALASVVVAASYRIGAALDPIHATELARPAPSTRGSSLWMGVSVTAVGHAHGPTRAPFVVPVALRVGADERRLIVFGDRAWERRGGGLAA